MRENEDRRERELRKESGNRQGGSGKEWGGASIKSIK